MPNFLKTAKAKMFALLSLASTSAFAEITVGEGGKLTGSIDTAPYLSGVVIVLGFLGSVWGVKKVISLLRV